MEQWFFKLYSDEYGSDTLGPYETKQEAQDAIVRVQERVARRNDGIIRAYSAPFTKTEDREF